jgi:polysaccharide deacetylase family protein (PEP-CTERM system associated)
MVHAFTVDVEDWFDGIPIDARAKAAAVPRLEKGLGRLLDLMAASSARGTFFFLAPVAERHPELLRRVAEAGHEIGCHGWSHDLLYEMGRERFRDETRRARDVLSQRLGRAVRAYRAAYFSITRDSYWALEELARLDFRYDSSIFPVRNWRYGIPDFPPRPQVVTTPSGPILELPLSVRRVLGRSVAVSGGAYFRIYPYALTRANIRAHEARRGPVVFYLHPWELDPDHPRVPFAARPRLTHYWNLRATEPRLRRLLADFRFAPLGEVLEHELAGTGP